MDTIQALHMSPALIIATTTNLDSPCDGGSGPEDTPSSSPTSDSSLSDKIDIDGRTITGIGSLPQEILEYIFDMNRGDAIDTRQGEMVASPCRKDVPVIPSQVCRYWRLIVVENPTWWSCIIISPPWNHQKIETYLRRSKQRPLDLYVYVHLNYNIDDDMDLLPPLDNYELIEALITPHLHRSRLIHIQGIFNKDKGLAFRIVKPLIGIDMPYLEEFIFDGEVHDTYGLPKDVSLFASAPRLRDVRLGGIGLLNFKFPALSSVTTLHLSRATDQGHLSFQYVGSMLQSCSCLSSLSVYDDLLSRSSYTTERIAACKLPFLETLQIFGNMLKVSELLLFLSAPNLRELVIAPFADGDLALLLSQPKDAHPRRFPLLKTLILAPARPEAVYALDGASLCLPGIEHLVLANLYIEELKEMFSRKDQPIFPDLIDLALTSLDKCDTSLIPTIYNSRKSQNMPLQTIYLDKASLQKISLAGIPDNLKLVGADLWEHRRSKALYSYIVDLFIGHTDNS